MDFAARMDLAARMEPSLVIAGLDPAIQVRVPKGSNMDARIRSGHDNP